MPRSKQTREQVSERAGERACRPASSGTGADRPPRAKLQNCAPSGLPPRWHAPAAPAGGMCIWCSQARARERASERACMHASTHDGPWAAHFEEEEEAAPSFGGASPIILSVGFVSPPFWAPASIQPSAGSSPFSPAFVWYVALLSYFCVLPMNQRPLLVQMTHPSWSLLTKRVPVAFPRYVPFASASPAPSTTIAQEQMFANLGLGGLALPSPAGAQPWAVGDPVSVPSAW
mmetsp:Transcript_41860/g.130300  ORF Transcript_41860/g.130300 Transcript_41860/m.130300 type:complete len:232 (-) Transcript_41860:281-976(-)